jgi:hypothetical protein
MSIDVGPEVGYQRVTGSSAVVIGDANRPIALYGFINKPSGATASNVVFSNGNTTTNTAVFDFTGVATIASVVTIPAAITFPLGLVVTPDSNSSYQTIIYRQVLT